MKKVYRGWVEKDNHGPSVGSWFFDEELKLKFPTIFKTKGKKKEWDDYQWPPKKITITIEID